MQEYRRETHLLTVPCSLYQAAVSIHRKIRCESENLQKSRKLHLGTARRAFLVLCPVKVQDEGPGWAQGFVVMGICSAQFSASSIIRGTAMPYRKPVSPTTITARLARWNLHPYVFQFVASALFFLSLTLLQPRSFLPSRFPKCSLASHQTPYAPSSYAKIL
jgi:hypothetical protein